MATIKLSDISSASVNATVLDDSALGKTTASEMHFLRSDAIGALSQTLDQVQINCLSIGFDFEPPFSLSGCTAKFTAGGGPTGELDLYKPAAGGASCPLIKTDQFGTKIEMGRNYYLALSFQLGVKAGGSAKDGAYTFTPSSSATGSAKLYLPFGPGVNGAYPTLRNALETLFGAFTLPSSKDDLLDKDKFPVGSVFAYDAQGTIGFKAKLNFLAAVNPTATPGVSTSYGPISVTTGPSVTIGGGFTLSGEIETRIWKKSATVVQIGYYKKQGSSFNVSFNVGAAADVTVGGFDVVAQIYSLLGDSGKLDPAWLKAHVPASVATDVQNAYKAAVETKLSIAIDAECDTSVTDQAAFSWNFDLSALDSTGQSALSDLLNGDLTALLSGADLPAGITKAGSILDRTTDVKHTFSFNFLGLFDHASVNDATLDMSAKVSEDGQLIITDTAHLTRLAATATPLVKGDQLRKVYVEDCVATIGYSASFGNFVPTLKVGYNYFSYKRHAHQADLQLFVDTATQLGEANATGDWAAMLQSNSVSQAASLFASLGYDGASGRSLFLDAAQNPRSIADYQQVGRNALLNTPGLGLSPQFIAGMNNPTVWPQLLDAGSSQHFYQILGVDLANPPQWAVVSFTWTLHVVYWASAMHSTAMALQSVLQYLTQNPGIYPLHDAGFLSKRKTFASQLQNAIQKAPLFDDALGLMTIFSAATPLSKSVTITYASITKTYA
ncbi:hypothetical protein [Terracidiphilus gabretensis]|uniref:hypothetical protein n=1 Tax=Terracidiphilus gabretensis TaxID=1577687 RepID=UPI00071B3E2A|nr:hypothetical protein [Terracidiphilus gabretensis]